MLERMIDRVRRAPELDDIILATTTNDADDTLKDLADQLGIPCFRGSEDDVMGRVLGAAVAFEADVIVELTGDCPVIDPRIVSRVIAQYRDSQVDYCANILERSYPIGMDVQVFSTAILADAAARTSDPQHREHVSLYIYRSPNRYSLRNVDAPREQFDPELRLTLDTPEDHKVLTAIFENLLPSKPHFSLNDIFALKNTLPEIFAANKTIAHRWV